MSRIVELTEDQIEVVQFAVDALYRAGELGGAEVMAINNAMGGSLFVVE